MTFIYDIINLEFITIIFIIIISHYLKLKPMKVMLLFFHIIAIFLLNDVLFDSQYWGDQSRYVGIAKTTRERLVSFQDFSVSGPLRLVIPGYLFAFSPMPFINSVQSIAMINFMIYFSTLIFLKKKRISSTFIDTFFFSIQVYYFIHL